MKPFAALLAAALLSAAPAFAVSEHSGHHGTPAADGVKDASLAEGEVKKVDKAAGKMTIKHGPLTALEMPPMTMVFRVKEPAMLDKVEVGDAIRFKAEKVGGSFTVTELQPAR